MCNAKIFQSIRSLLTCSPNVLISRRAFRCYKTKNSNMSLALLPIFDLSFLASDTQPSAELLQRVDKACRGNGFFQILNHGVPVSLQQDMMDVTQKLYSLPLESKMRLSLSSSHKRRGKI